MRWSKKRAGTNGTAEDTPDRAKTRTIAGGDVTSPAASASDPDEDPDFDPTSMVFDLANAPAFVDRRVALGVCFGVIAIGTFLLVESRNIRGGLVQGELLGATGLPRIMGWFLVIAGAVLAIRRLKDWKNGPLMVSSDGGDADEEGYPTTYVRPFAFLLVGLGWIHFLPNLGFLVMTTLAGVALLLLAKVRSPLKLLLVPLLFAFTTWTLFDRMIGVRLPAGGSIGRFFDRIVPLL